LAAPLKPPHGFLVCRGTLFGNHCSRLFLPYPRSHCLGFPSTFVGSYHRLLALTESQNDPIANDYSIISNSNFPLAVNAFSKQD